jgi:hypothetical protein
MTRARIPRSPLLVLVLFVSASGSACLRPLVGNASAVTILLDYSKSFAPYSHSDIAALNETTKAVVRMVRGGSLQQPLKILWAAFGDNGLQPVEPCGPARVFQQRLTGGSEPSVKSPDPAEPLISVDKLEAWFSVCSEAVQSTSQAAQQFTDISGAMAFAADTIEDVRGDRVIVLFSDLREDLPPNRQLPPFRLNSVKVLLIWRPGLDDRKQPTATPERVEEWRTRIESAGASRVCAKAAQGLTEGEISSCLWN